MDTEFVRSIWQRYDALATDCSIGSASGACFLMPAPARLLIMSVSTRRLCGLPVSNSMPDRYSLPPSWLSPCQPFPLTASISSTRQTRPIHECTYTADPHPVMRQPRGAHDSLFNPLANWKVPAGSTEPGAHQAHSTCRRYPNPSPPAWACRPSARCLTPADPHYHSIITLFLWEAV